MKEGRRLPGLVKVDGREHLAERTENKRKTPAKEISSEISKAGYSHTGGSQDILTCLELEPLRLLTRGMYKNDNEGLSLYR